MTKHLILKEEKLFKVDFMAKKIDKVFMPASWAGLMRFGEEEKEFIKLKPEYVIYACIGIIALEVLLRFFF